MDRKLARWTPLALTGLLLIGVAATQQVGHRMAYVNLQVVMQQTPGYQEARDTFETVEQSFRTEIEGLQSSYDSMVAAYQQQQVVLSPTARQEKEAELRQFGGRVQQRVQEIQNRLAQRERTLLAPLEDRVQAVIDGIRAERNLAVIFDVSAQGNGIVAADTNLDLTATVVQRLQASN